MERRQRNLRFENLESRRLLAADLGSYHNVADPEDVNNDGAVNVADAFITIDEVRGRRVGEVLKLVDVDADGTVSVKDAFHVIARLRQGGGETTSPLEQRIERLTGAIENGTLPSQFTSENAERLLNRLQTEWAERNGEGPADPIDLAGRLIRRFNRIDADGDGRLSETEVQGEGEAFAQILESAPQHEEGILSEDFIAALEGHFEELGERLDNPTDAFAVFEFLDANNDQGLSEDEVPTPEVWDALSPSDSNGDNSLTEEELVDYGRTLLEEQAQELFNLLDINRDGSIAATDVAPIAWFFLRNADQNEDDLISYTEFQEIPLQLLERFHGDS